MPLVFASRDFLFFSSEKIADARNSSAVIPPMRRFAFASHCIEAAKSDLFGTKFLETSMFTAQIVARLKADEEAYVRRRAEQEDRSVSSVIRCLVNEAIKSERQQPQHTQAA